MLFLPIPGNFVKYDSFSFSIAIATSLGVLVAKIAKADFGPIPVTLIKLKTYPFLQDSQIHIIIGHLHAQLIVYILSFLYLIEIENDMS